LRSTPCPLPDLPLSSSGLSRAARLSLSRAGFRHAREVLSLAPTQLADELRATPLQALAIIKQLQADVGDITNGEAMKDMAAIMDATAAADSSNGGGADAAQQPQPPQGSSSNGNGAAARPVPSASPSASPGPDGKTAGLGARMASAAKQDAPSFGTSALDLLRRAVAWKPVPSLCQALDRLCNGGVPVGQVTEFCGIPGCK